jgi:hypothetical protein
MEMEEIAIAKNMKKLFICFILFQNLTISDMPRKYWACNFFDKVHSFINNSYCLIVCLLFIH